MHPLLLVQETLLKESSSSPFYAVTLTVNRLPSVKRLKHTGWSEMMQIMRTGIMSPSAKGYMRRIQTVYAKVRIHTRERQNKGDPFRENCGQTRSERTMRQG